MNISVHKRNTFAGHNGAVYALAAGAELVFSGSSDCFVAGWNPAQPARPVFTARFPSPVYAIRFLGDKNLLLAGTGSGSLHAISLEKKEELKILQLHSAQVFDIAYSPVNRMLITAGADGQISFSGEDFSFIKAGRITGRKVRSLALSPDEKRLAVACGDGNIRIFSLPEAEEIISFPAHELSANALAWHPEGKYLLSGGRDAFLKAWDTENGFTCITSIPAHNYAIYKIVFSPDTRLFATASRDKTVKLWDAETVGFLLRVNKEQFDAHVNSVNTLLWNSQGLFSAGDDRSLLQWDIRCTD